MFFASKKLDVREFARRLNSVFDGKGGRKENYVQGKISYPLKEIVQQTAENILCEDN